MCYGFVLFFFFLLNSSKISCTFLFANSLYGLVYFSLSSSLCWCLRRFELRGLLVLWNSALALFSIMGAMRTAPELIHVLLKFGLFHSVCNQRLVLFVSFIKLRFYFLVSSIFVAAVLSLSMTSTVPIKMTIKTSIHM